MVDEARELCSAASEVAAIAADRGFRYLKAPVARITTPNVPIPFSPPLEKFVMPNADKIVRTVQTVVDY